MDPDDFCAKQRNTKICFAVYFMITVDNHFSIIMRIDFAVDYSTDILNNHVSKPHSVDFESL